MSGKSGTMLPITACSSTGQFCHDGSCGWQCRILPPAYVERVRTELHAAWAKPRVRVFGHMGDGNLHILVSPDGLPADARATIERVVYAPLQALGGAISAEHGIGLEKRPWLSISRSESEIALMRTLKQAMDPKGILNPGRVM